MDTRRLEIFLKLLDTRSFSKTALALGMTQPSVSASLKALEESLGQKLFERTPRTVRPLPAAETLTPYAASIVETAARAAWAVGHQLAGSRESLKLGASSVPAMIFLPPAMAEFQRKFPGILMTLKTGQSQGVVKRLVDGELDLGVVGSPPESDELSRTVFGRDRLVLLASESLAAQVGPPPQNLDELRSWPLIMREEGSGTRAAFLAGLAEKAGDLAGGGRVVAEVEGWAPCLALVRCSFGAAVVSSLVAAELDQAGLTVMNLNFLPGRRFYLIRRKVRKTSPAVEALADILLETAKEKGGEAV